MRPASVDFADSWCANGQRATARLNALSVDSSAKSSDFSHGATLTRSSNCALSTRGGRSSLSLPNTRFTKSITSGDERKLRVSATPGESLLA